MSSNVFRIKPTTQKYDWGKIGKESQVAQLAAASQLPDFTLEESSPYAELWMGTHPTSPSHVLSSNKLLSEHISANLDLLGKRVVEHFDASNGQLPFLFKVLSVQKALSIQTHPDKPTAEKLHAEQPNIYKDANHKPEMALALTPFKALCGFLPLPEIAHYLTSTPELAALLPPTIVSNFLSIASSPTPTGVEEKTQLKNLFAAIMTAPEDQVKAQLTKLVERFKSAGATPESDGVEGLVVRLDSQFPGDIGIFCAFVLNYITLKPGEAIFLGAGEPHAYIAGDIMECMAASDNVIRAGLTPKLRDIPNLVSGLTYVSGPPNKHFVKPSEEFSQGSTLYDPPIPEFSVLRTLVDSGKSADVRALEGPGVAVISGGSGEIVVVGDKEESQKVKKGDVFFIGAGTKVRWEASEELAVYTAFVEAPTE